MSTTHPQHIKIESYNYNLPDERIAKYPLSERDSSKLLVSQNGKIIDTTFKTIVDYLPDHSLMFFNNTKVIQARLQFRKETGARIEIFCLEPHNPKDYLSAFQQTSKCSWLCLVGNSKKWKEGKLVQEFDIDGEKISLTAQRLHRVGDASEVEFGWDNTKITFADILDHVGELPIPPYLNRDTEDADLETYQTVYSKIIGSVAAPTAGLHFTAATFESLSEKGIAKEELTLHVGAGTFRPVQSSEIGGHDMHSELISVKRTTIERILNNNRNIVAVGTTSVRTLESLYYLGLLLSENKDADLHVSQWMPYNKIFDLTVEESLNEILKYFKLNNLDTLVASTAIMIAPGYEFKIVDAIVTNFHQPQSTLLLLVSAFLGENKWQDIYNHALTNGYRFLSYGDSSLLTKE